jgi:hypothetical protein
MADGELNGEWRIEWRMANVEFVSNVDLLSSPAFDSEGIRKFVCGA